MGTKIGLYDSDEVKQRIIAVDDTSKRVEIRDGSDTDIMDIESHGSRHAATGDDALPSDAIATAMIQDDAVTSAKVADGAITTAKVADGCLSADATGRAKVADGFVTYAKLDTNTKRFVVGVRIPADSAAGDTWERAVFYAYTAVTVIDAGIVPDASFGQATDYAILEVQNKGTDGTGTTSLASKNFDSAVSAYDFTSLGTISNASVSAGEVLTFKKSVGGSGQIVPASLLVLVLERSE